MCVQYSTGIVCVRWWSAVRYFFPVPFDSSNIARCGMHADRAAAGHVWGREEHSRLLSSCLSLLLYTAAVDGVLAERCPA